MKKLLFTLGFLLISTLAHATTTWYVSNAAINGTYVIGNNSNNCTSPATACLTINGAKSKSSSGDTFIINPTSNSKTSANNPYLESTQVATNSSATYTYESDPAYTSTYAVIQSTGTNDVFLSGGGSVVTAIGLILDVQNVATKRAWKGGSDSSLTLSQITPVNCASGSNPINAFTSGNLTFDRITVDPSCNNSSATGFVNLQVLVSGSVTVKGGNYTAPWTTGNYPMFYLGGANITSFTTTNDVNGNPVFVSGDTEFVNQANGTIGTLELDDLNSQNTFIDWVFSSGTSYSTVSTIFNAKNNVVNCLGFSPLYCVTAGGSSPFIANVPETVVLGTFSGNTISTAGTGSSGEAGGILLPNGTGSPNINHNTINWNGINHASVVGTDGFTIGAQNTATTTGGQKLGDVTNDTYVDQFITTLPEGSGTPGNNGGSYSSYIAGIEVELESSGSPTQNITAALYADNAGNPGTLIAASSTVLSATSLTSSYGEYEFDFALPPYVTAGTKVHFVFQASAISASNYILMNENTTTTLGSLLTSPDNSTWTPNTSNALYLYLFTGAYGIHDAKVEYNSFTNTYAGISSDLSHEIAMGGQLRGTVDHNIINGGSLGVMFKENRGGSSGNPALAYDNLINQQQGSQDYVAPILLKNSSFVDYFNNIVLTGSSTYGPTVAIIADVNTIGSPTYHPLNTGVSNNDTIQNNIIVQNSSSFPVYAFIGNGLQTLPSNITISNNDVWNPNSAPLGQTAYFLNGITPTTLNTYSSWASWQGQGYDVTGSINSDPLLHNEINPVLASDFIPGTGSPAKGIGVSTGGLVTTDYLGNPFAPIPDIGAYSLSYSGYQIPSYQYSNSVISATNYAPPLFNTSFPINVGIGSANAGATLDVNGTVRTTGFVLSGNNATAGFILQSNGSLGIGTWVPEPSGGGSSQWSGTSGSNIYYNLANVGIGTSLTSNTLDVARNVSIGTAYAGYVAAPINGLLVQGNVGLGTINPGKSLDVQGTIRALGQIINGNLGIGTSFVNGTGEAALSVMNGNVGIGTWVPAYSLDIESASTTANTVNINNTAGTGNTGGTLLNVVNSSSLSVGYTGNEVNITGNKLSGTGTVLNVTGGTSATSAPELQSGSLMVGNFTHISNNISNYTQAGNILNLSRNNTVNSSGVLTVSGAVATISDTASNSGTLTHTGDVLDLTQNYTLASGSVLKAVQSGTGPVAIFTGGNVGIGSITPGQALDINGTVRALSSGTCTSLYRCVGGVDAGVIQTSACNLCPAGTCSQMNGCF